MSDSRKRRKREPLPDVDRKRAEQEIRRRATDPKNRPPGYTVANVVVESMGRDGANQTLSVEVTYKQADPRGLTPTILHESWREPLDELIGASLDYEESVLLADEDRLLSQIIHEQEEFGEEKPGTERRRKELSRRRVQHVRDRLDHLRPDSQLRDYSAVAASTAPLQLDPNLRQETVPGLREDLKTKARAKVASELKRFKESKSPLFASTARHAAQRLLQSASTAKQLGDEDPSTEEALPEAIFERFPGARNPQKQTRTPINPAVTGTNPWTTRAERAKGHKPIDPDLKKQRGVSDPGTENRSVPRTPAR